jgi:hypothetical protein
MLNFLMTFAVMWVSRCAVVDLSIYENRDTVETDYLVLLFYKKPSDIGLVEDLERLYYNDLQDSSLKVTFAAIDESHYIPDQDSGHIYLNMIFKFRSMVPGQLYLFALG